MLYEHSLTPPIFDKVGEVRRLFNLFYFYYNLYSKVESFPKHPFKSARRCCLRHYEVRTLTLIPFCPLDCE